ncbi:MAG: glycosyltransferase family 39 protein [Pirellulales bacterium]
MKSLKNILAAVQAVPVWWWVLLITVVGAGLRIYDLGGESIWLDEAHTYRRMTVSLPAMLADCHQRGQGPLYYLLARPWCDVAGCSEFAMRFPAAVFGTLCIPMIFVVAAKLWNKTAGLCAAWLLTIHPFAIHYAQEARPYSLFLLLALGSYFALLKLLDRNDHRSGDHRWLWGYAAFTTAALYTHPYGVFVAVSQALIFMCHLLSTRQRPGIGRWKQLYTAVGLVTVLYLPQLIHHATSYMANPVARIGWIKQRSFLYMLEIPIRHSMYDPLGYLAAALVAVAILVGLRRGTALLKDTGLVLVASVACSFLLLPWIMSAISNPMLVIRYTIVAMAAFALLLAWAVSTFPARIRASALLLLTVVAAIPLNHYFTYACKEPWRAIAAELRERVQPGDLVVSTSSGCDYALRFYMDGTPFAPQVFSVSNRRDLAAALTSTNRLWLIRSYGNNRRWKPLVEASTPVEILSVNDPQVYIGKRRMTAQLYRTSELRRAAYYARQGATQFR